LTNLNSHNQNRFLAFTFTKKELISALEKENRMRFIALIISLLFNLSTIAMQKSDSLLRLAEISSNKDQTAIYLQLVQINIKDSALSNYYNKKAYQLAVANNQQKEKAKSVYLSGRICVAARDFTKAILYLQKALPLLEELKDTTNMTTCWSYIGISNFNMSKSKEAITAYLEGLKLSKNDPDYSAELLANIGLVHDEMDNFKEAISYYNQAIVLNQTIRDTGSLAIDYDYLGAAYARMKMPDSAIVNYHKALYLFKKIGKDDRYAVSLSNIATVFPYYADSLGKAITYFNMAWEKFKELGWDYYEVDIQQGIADVLTKEGRYNEAIAAYNKSLQLAFKFKREYLIKKTIYLHLSEAYQKRGDYIRALESHVLFSQYNDSVNEKQKFEQIANLEKQYETEKKEKEIIQLQSKQELTNIQLVKNKQLKILGFVSASLLLVFVFVVLIRYYDKAKLNRLLESKNRKIEKSENELRILNSAKNKFFSIIAHDLKNPFHTVMGYSELLNKEYDHFTELERRKFAGDIHQSSNKIFQLLQNLLEWAKSQTGRLTVNPVEVELKKLVVSATSVLRPIADQKKITMKTDFEDKVILFADPLMIETVLRNLINNAIKFTPENGLIEITTTKVENKVTICVKDNGTGISEADAKNLFQIDSTVKRKGTNNEDGSGLGLILCKEFVEKNNGAIWVESSLGQGSSFFFTVPAREPTQS